MQRPELPEVSQARKDAADRSNNAALAECTIAASAFVLGNPWLATLLLGIAPQIAAPILLGAVIGEFALGARGINNANRRDLLRSRYISDEDSRVAPIRPEYQKIFNLTRRLTGRSQTN